MDRKQIDELHQKLFKEHCPMSWEAFAVDVEQPNIHNAHAWGFANGLITGLKANRPLPQPSLN